MSADPDLEPIQADQDIATEPLVFVPGKRFFVVRKSLPEGIKRKDIDGFVEMVLEEESPFPIEQMMFGYVVETTLASVLIYALYAEGLDMPEAKYLYPSFFPALFRQCDSDFFYKNGDDLCKIIVDNGVIQDVLPVSKADEYWEYEEVKYLNDGGIEFVNKHGQEREYVRLEANGFERWEGDIRDSILVQDEQKDWKRGKMVLKGLYIAAIVAAGLLASEVFKYMGYGYVALQKDTVEERITQVSEIESEDGLASKIEEINTDYYTPFKVLELLNKYRPDEVYFTSISLGSTNNAVIEGVGATVEVVNKYEADLEASGLTSDVDIGDIISRRGKIVFKMTAELNVSDEEDSDL